MVSIEEISVFAKKKGFVFQSADIYGGLSGFFDFGPYGVEMKNNIKQLLWKEFVNSREDVIGIDGAIITNPKVWDASGHTTKFDDLMLEYEGGRVRADQYLEQKLGGNFEGVSADEVNALVEKHGLKSPNGKDFKKCKSVNLMLSTNVGTDTKSFLRPETAQLIFTNFKLAQDTARKKLPFGIAQSGKAFRNEISPRDFLFRTREFEQFEIEYFLGDSDYKKCPLLNEVSDVVFNVADGEKTKEVKFSEIKFKSEWHGYWLAKFYQFFLKFGISAENLRIREHAKKELAHYANACFDIEYKFPFGWKEIHGSADRGTFDLDQHIKASKKDLAYFNEETKEKTVPKVIEPSQGIERALLAFLFDAYKDDKERGNIVLSLNASIAPVKVAVFPLVNKLDEKAREVFTKLKSNFTCTYDKSGSVGRRYARADELGIPFCITVDFDTLKDMCVTVRDRDTTKQKRVYIDELQEFLSGLLN